MAELKPVDFKVTSIEPGDAKGFVKIDVVFDGNSKVYNYYRKSVAESDKMYVIISGCKVLFDGDCNVIEITREYNMKGIYRKSTKGLSKTKGRTSESKEESWEEVDVESERSGKRPRNKIRVTPSEDIEEHTDDEPVVSNVQVIEESSDDTTEQEVKEEEPNVEVKEEEPVVKMPKKIRHEAYEDIVMCLDIGLNVFLYGPAGAGKNYTLEQIARERGWNFYFSNSVQQEYKLTGFIDAGGRYHETEFYKACTDEEECMFFLDEVDASDPSVLVLLNAAIANGYFEFPTGKVSLGNVHFVAAGNTVGSGADDMYTGRYALDVATLDRFQFIEFDYSRVIEEKITNNNTELIDFIHKIREVAKTKGIRTVFSYRCMIATIKLEAAGMDLNKIMKIAIVKGLDQDTINTINIYGMPNNKYVRALRAIQA